MRMAAPLNTNAWFQGKSERDEKSENTRRPQRAKIQKQSWNAYDNKRLLFLESPRSWNVVDAQ
jgi:hypothetical protein